MLFKKMSGMCIPPKLVCFFYDLLYKSYTNVYLCKLTVYNAIVLTRTGYRGLAQGCVLSPLLYCVYTSDSDLSIPTSAQLLQYAEDCVISISGNGFYTTQDTLCSGLNWKHILICT